MAFHQPTRQALQRTLQATTSRGPEGLHSQASHRAQPHPVPDETRSWVLFSPGGNATSSSYLGGADESLRTAGRSKGSDFGSLDTNVRSAGGLASQPISPGIPESLDENALEEDAELDSLDSHLPDFRVVQNPYVDTSAANEHSAPVLPRHDGLGSFKLDQPVPGADLQEQIYAFERFNPNRVSRHDEAAEAHDTEPGMTQRMKRIESWSLEQSRLVLEHIQKETRTTRRPSHSTTTTTRSRRSAMPVEEDVVMSKSEGTQSAVSPGEHDHLDWHDGDAESSVENQGILSRMTRAFLKDVIGIDERLLSILLGESLPDEARDQLGDSHQSDLPQEETPWQLSVLERVAKELGFLINRASHHPGAFSTYARMQRMPLPYAGLPVIPEASMVPESTQVPGRNDGLSATIPEFQPTFDPSQTMGMQDSRQHARRDSASSSNTSGATFTQEEWEQDLDIKLVFRYLRSRFGPHPSPPPASAGTSHLATSSTQDTAAKAARVRQYHPLISSRPRAVERRSFKATTPTSPGLLRNTSSCASQSTRRSARRSSVSSRHYWDIGGSLGTGSVIASTGPMGSWGEV